MVQRPKRIAVLRLLLPDGSVRMRQVLTLDAAQRVLSYEPLTHELAFVTWHAETWTLEGRAAPIDLF